MPYRRYAFLSRRGAHAARLLGLVAGRLLRALLALMQRARDRRLLGRLDDRTLRDVGLDRGAVERDRTTWSRPLR
jgi:uncharacterized protein YjiS (DUF1127 family)